MRLRLTRVIDEQGNERDIRSARTKGLKYTDLDPEKRSDEKELYSVEGSPSTQEGCDLINMWLLHREDLNILDGIFDELREIRAVHHKIGGLKIGTGKEGYLA